MFALAGCGRHCTSLIPQQEGTASTDARQNCRATPISEIGPFPYASADSGIFLSPHLLPWVEVWLRPHLTPVQEEHRMRQSLKIQFDVPHPSMTSGQIQNSQRDTHSSTHEKCPDFATRHDRTSS